MNQQEYNKLYSKIENFIRILPIPCKFSVSESIIFIQIGIDRYEIPVNKDIHTVDYPQLIRCIISDYYPKLSIKINDKNVLYTIKKAYIKKDTLIVENDEGRIVKYITKIPISEFLKEIRKLDIITAGKYFTKNCTKIQYIDTTDYEPDFKDYNDSQIENFIKINYLSINKIKLDLNNTLILNTIEYCKSKLKSNKDIIKEYGIKKY